MFWQSPGIPDSRSRKAELLKFLEEKGISLEGKPTVKVLWQLVKKELEKNPRRTVDDMVAAKNIKLLRLPPYHCEVTMSYIAKCFDDILGLSVFPL